MTEYLGTQQHGSACGSFSTAHEHDDILRYSDAEWDASKARLARAQAGCFLAFGDSRRSRGVHSQSPESVPVADPAPREILLQFIFQQSQQQFLFFHFSDSGGEHKSADAAVFS